MYDHKVLPDMTGTRPDSTISLVRFDPVKEMDILRTVVLRDALVTLLAEQRRKFMSGGKLCVETVLCALLETREASLEVIDAITRWRLTLVKPEPFNVRGKNYAVEMTTDVGFLATGLTPLKEAFGLEFGTGNPFALPCAPSLNVVVARDRGGGNGKAAKGKAGQGKASGKASGKAAQGKATGVTTGRAATGEKAAPGCTGGREKAKNTAKQEVAPVRGATGDIDPPDGGGVTPPVDKQPAEDQEQTGVEGSGGTQREADGVAQDEVEVAPRPPDEEERLELKDSDQDGEGVEGRRYEGGRSIREVLCRLGDVDDEQRARLAKAQRFLEEEVARSNAKPREEAWWGFHRWTARPWAPSEHLPP